MGWKLINKMSKLWTNDEYDMKVRLQAEPKLTDASGQNPIDLSVALGKADLGVQDTVYSYSVKFSLQERTMVRCHFLW